MSDDYIVGKPFKTVNRRFNPSADPAQAPAVQPADVEGLDWKHLVDSGFVVKRPAATKELPPPMPAGDAEN